MKDTYHFIGKIKVVICTLLLSGCINDIKEDEPKGPVPITLNAKVYQSKSRVIETDFEKGDAIGLYVLLEPGKIEDSRFVDNNKFTYSGNGEFQSESSVFYPEDDQTCYFLSYYPFTDSAIKESENTITVNVMTDQSDHANYTLSDFMVAECKNISATQEAVTLLFEHKLSKLNIILEAGEGYSPESLLASDPDIKITNIYTSAIYNVDKKSVADQDQLQSIIPNGEWKVENDKLSGKRAIIIPQLFTASKKLLEIKVDDLLFEYIFSKDYSFLGGVPLDLILTISSSNGLESRIVPSIRGWEEPESEKGQLTEVPSVIKCRDLKFNESDVYQVIHNNNPIALIAKEYLSGNGIDNKAVVLYPYSNNKPDLSNGWVLELSGITDKKHGGSIAWNKGANTFDYVEGNSSPVSYIYFDPEYNASIKRPEKAVQITLQPFIFADKRGNEQCRYPVVKIGTQFWLKENLKTACYTDGQSIPEGNDFTITTAQFGKDDGNHFYNSACIKTGKLIPDGWRIGNVADWQALKTYINNDSRLIKKQAVWQYASDLTGFSAIPCGSFNEKRKPADLNEKHIIFWCTHPDKPDIVSKSLFLSDVENTVNDGSSKNTLGISIRCLLDE